MEARNADPSAGGFAFLGGGKSPSDQIKPRRGCRELELRRKGKRCTANPVAELSALERLFQGVEKNGQRRERLLPEGGVDHAMVFGYVFFKQVGRPVRLALVTLLAFVRVDGNGDSDADAGIFV